MKILGIAGPAGSGKDTAADYLARVHGFEQYAFAEPLRAGLKAILSLSDYRFAPENKEKPIAPFGKSPRQLMQSLGTEWGRNLVHPDLWLLLAEQWLARKKHSHEYGVISDVRFENEAAWIRKHGGQILHLHRDQRGRVNPHISESGITFHPQLGDIRINNSGTLIDLEEMIDALINEMTEIV